MPSLATLGQDLRNFSKYHLKRRVFDHPASETQLGVVPLDLDFDAYVESIRAFGDRFTITTVAELAYRGARRPILHVRGVRPGNTKRLLVLAGVHGNEHAGLLAVPQILENHRSVREGGVDLHVLTPVNPVGAAELSRYNADGYDINRDFVRFLTREARAVRDTIADVNPDFIVSLHEGPQDATFFFANEHVERALALRLLKAIEAGGTTLATKDYFGSTLTPAGYAPMSKLGWSLSWLWARALGMMTTGMYANERGIPEITIESSWRLPSREARVAGHVDLVSALLEAL